jgi:hypothetical protein
MKITKVLEFNSEDVAAMVHFRGRIFHPMCDILTHQCQFCPFNEACSNLDEFFDKVITDGQWFIPESEE